jgi:hypothetical protein
MADAGFCPVYHGNEAETDLMAVGDVDWMPVFSRLTHHGQICIRVKPADARKVFLSVCNEIGNYRIDPFWMDSSPPFSDYLLSRRCSKT